MKVFINLVSILFFLSFFSCKKDDVLLQQSTFVKSYKAGFDITVSGGFALDDGNYMILCNDYYRTLGADLLKIDVNGKVLWQKPLTPLIKYVWSAIPVPGIGFAVVGIEHLDSFATYLCVHDYEGNLLSTDTIVTSIENWQKTPHNLMQLSNGNFVLAGGGAYNSTGTIRILNPDFTVLSTHTFRSPVWTNLVYCKAVCELSDATIAFIANVSNNNNGIKNLMIVMTDLNGTILHTQHFSDPDYSEFANAVYGYQEGFVAVTGRMKGNNFGDIHSYSEGNGMFVLYDNNSFNSVDVLVSGRINIKQFSNTGQILRQTEVIDYPLNGLMNSLRPTQDGGFILCGTVNQLSTFALISDTKIFLLKLDANLNTSWSKVIPTAYPALGIHAIQTPDDGYLVTALNKSLNKQTQALVIKTDANGNY